MTRRNRKDPQKCKFYAVLSILNSWMLFESYINSISLILVKGRLAPHEKAVLLDREIRIDDDGDMIDTNSHIPVLKRTLFLLSKFSQIDTKDLKQADLWKQIKGYENLRNEIMHPRDFNTNRLDLDVAENMRNTIILFIKQIHKSVFNKSISIN